jgi:carboxypeptidase T
MAHVLAQAASALLLSFVLAIVCVITVRAQEEVPEPVLRLGPAGLVVEIAFATQADANRLAGWLDVWEVDRRAHTLVAYVTPEQQAELVQQGYQVDTLERAQTASVPNFACYRTVEETYDDLAQLAQAAPNLAQWVDIGDSWLKVQTADAEGYDLHVLVLTNRLTPAPKPRFFLMAALHARELTTAETATRFAEQLIERYGIDPDVTWLLDYNEIHILPQSNPDGRKRAEGDAGGYISNPNALWRKNVNNTLCTDNRRYGVDLNRNGSYRWGACEGFACSSDSACDLTYRGTGPASEPETQAIEVYLRSLFPDRRGPGEEDAAPVETQGIMISLHSYSELILFPWGWRTARAPNDAGLRTLGRKFGYFTGYETCQAGEEGCIYMTDGSTDDFAYGELGVPSYTFELGTTFFESCGFFETSILPQTLAALTYAAKVAVKPYQMPAGPDVVNPTVTPALVAPGDQVILRAELDDARTLRHSNFGTEPVQAIASATYTVDAPSWSSEQGPGTNMQAVDVFDKSHESAIAVIDTTGWSLGRHTIFVQASDDSGNTGPPTAVFVEIGYPVYLPFLDTARR